MIRRHLAPVAIVAALAWSSAWADTTVTTFGGGRQVVKGFTTPDGKEVPASAPFAIPVTPVHTTVTITTAGTPVSLPANTARRGGWCYLPLAATGTAAFSLTGTASTTPGGQDGEIVQGGTLPFVQNGLLVQGAISFNSTSSGVQLDCVELQ